MTNLNPYYFKELLKNDIIFTLHAKELKSGLKQKEYAFVGHSVCHGTQISTSIKCIYMSCYPYILVRMCPGTYLSQSHMCHPICHGILLPVAEPSRAKYSQSLPASQDSSPSLLQRLGTVSDRPQGSHAQRETFQMNQNTVMVTSIIWVCIFFYINQISSYSFSLFSIFSSKAIL